MRALVPLLAAGLVLAACGGASSDGDGRGDDGSTRRAGETIDLAGAPFTVRLPKGLEGAGFTPHGATPITGEARFAVAIGPAGGGAAVGATVLAIPAGEPLADAPAELGRRTWLSLTGSGGATAGSTHGPFTARAVGGRPGFAFTASTGGDLTEYRGAAVGTWLVLEACTRLDATAAPTVTCDALGDGLVLREAPAPPAAPAGSITGELAPYRLVRPAGFAEAPASSEEDVLATIEADEATVLVHSWENTILIAAFARDDEAAAVVDSSAYCDFLATGFPRTTHRLTPDDHAFAGRKGGGCLVEPIPGAEPATLMPDQHVRLHQLHIDRWVLQVACSSTTAQRLITDRACDQVLATMTLVAAS